MKKTKRVMSLLLISTLAVGMTFMTGCSQKTNPAKSVVVTVNDKDIYLNEMMYYIMAVESTGAQYEAAYQQYTGTSYWDQKDPDDPNGLTIREQAKNYVMDTAEMYQILYDKAVKEGYTLTDDEKTQAQNNADQILSNISKDQLEVTGFTKDVLTDIMQKMSLGGKYYKDLVDSFDIDDDGIKATIKPEEYRQYNTEYLFVPTTKYDENYNSVDLSEDEKSAAKATITAALEKVKAGEEFSKIKEADDKLTDDTLNFVADDGKAEKAYQDAAIKLDNDACTEDIVETDTGYYIIKMVDNNSTEAYDSAVSDAISKAEGDAFDTEFEKMKKDYTIKINSKVWDPIVIGKTTLLETTGSPDTATPNTTSTGDAANTAGSDSTADNTVDGNTAIGE